MTDINYNTVASIYYNIYDPMFVISVMRCVNFYSTYCGIDMLIGYLSEMTNYSKRE